MARIEQRLEELGIVLPKPMNTGSLPFDLVRIDGERKHGRPARRMKT